MRSRLVQRYQPDIRTTSTMMGTWKHFGRILVAQSLCTFEMKPTFERGMLRYDEWLRRMKESMDRDILLNEPLSCKYWATGSYNRENLSRFVDSVVEYRAEIYSYCRISSNNAKSTIASTSLAHQTSHHWKHPCKSYTR